jgi:hypothetical protein
MVSTLLENYSRLDLLANVAGIIGGSLTAMKDRVVQPDAVRTSSEPAGMRFGLEPGESP